MTTHEIERGEGPDGSLTYLIGFGPEQLPPVHQRDLDRAWDAARRAAASEAWDVIRLFRFRRAAGGETNLALTDPDACCWAGAIDLGAGLCTRHGLSLCLRLLALVDLLGRCGWAARLCRFTRDGAELHPALMRAAAELPLTNEAGLDENKVRARLAVLQDGSAGALPLAD